MDNPNSNFKFIKFSPKQYIVSHCLGMCERLDDCAPEGAKINFTLEKIGIGFKGYGLVLATEGAFIATSYSESPLKVLASIESDLRIQFFHHFKSSRKLVA